MTDIVERLRNGAYADLFMQCAMGDLEEGESCLRCEAADEIERLRREVAGWRYSTFLFGGDRYRKAMGQ